MKKHYYLFLVFLYGCSDNTAVFENTINTGDLLIVKNTYHPSFLNDGSLSQDYSIKWSNGNIEDIPDSISMHHKHHYKTYIIEGRLYLSLKTGFMYREGDKDIVKSEWESWKYQPEESLFRYFYLVAKESPGKCVIENYQIPKRLREHVVSETEKETVKRIRYNNSNYFLSQTRHGAWDLPHVVDEIDFNNKVIIFKSKQIINGMPMYFA